MKIAFFASGLSPHISGICDELFECFGFDFCFFATEAAIRPSIEIMGAGELHLSKPYYRNINENSMVAKEALLWARNADVAIVGCSGCYEYIDERFRAGDKLTLKLRERLFKDGDPTHVNRALGKKISNCFLKYRNSSLYYLTAGTFAPYDFETIGIPTQKLIRWGYFPGLSSNQRARAEADYAGTIRLIWVGRFVREKLYMNVVTAFKNLLEKGFDVHLDLVGYGEGERCVKTYIEEHGLGSHITIHGAMEERGIRALLQQCHIFLMTSNYEEGWGAVLNEAMSEGCIPVASLATGATGELMEDGNSGRFFFYDNPTEIVDQLVDLLLHRDLLPALSQNAIRQIGELWNSKVATRRLLEWIESWSSGLCVDEYETGPCARINIIRDERELAAKLLANAASRSRTEAGI